MKKTMLNDEQRERRPAMRAAIVRSGAAALLFMGVFVFYSSTA